MSERDWHVTDCGCRVNVFVGLPPEASYTAKFYFCPLHAVAPDLLAALAAAQWGTEELCPDCSAFSGDGHCTDCKLAAAIAKALRRRDANHVGGE